MGEGLTERLVETLCFVVAGPGVIEKVVVNETRFACSSIGKSFCPPAELSGQAESTTKARKESKRMRSSSGRRGHEMSLSVLSGSSALGKVQTSRLVVLLCSKDVDRGRAGSAQKL